MRTQARRASTPVAIALAVLAAACGSHPASGSTSGRSPVSGSAIVPVTKVTDGDTLHVTYGGRDERVRLIGVDTPEVSWYGGTGECFGEEAGRFTRNRLEGRTVRLEFDVDLRDRYERLLAYVFVGDELFNLTLVEEGYATSDRVAPDTARAAQFEAAERQARAAGAGLWSACP
jgi:micrococcal nuclease